MKQIPSTSGLPESVKGHAEAVKENIEELRGVRGTKIKPLAGTASLTDVINKMNELLTRIQG